MTLKCDCGGTMQPRAAEKYDFSALAGLAVVVTDVPVMHCDRCGEETLRGEIVESIFQKLTHMVLQKSEALQPEEFRYLRKELRLSPEELARELGVSKTSVVAWESKKRPIPLDADQYLRHLVNSDPRVAVETDAPEHLPPRFANRGASQRRTPQSGRLIVSGDHLAAAPVA